MQGFNSFKEQLANARRAALEAGADIPDILKKQEAALNRLFKVGGNVAKGSSNVLLYTSRQLQAKFKHARDFGVVGNYSRANAAKFSSALNNHINASGTQIIQGAYRNVNNPVTFYLNPKTGLNIIASPSGYFISGAALSSEQVQGILTKGFLW